MPFVLSRRIRDAYLPKIEVFEALNPDRDAVVYTLQATFSVPKILYGNSVQEVCDSDLDKVIFALRLSLARAGIEVSSDAIATARVPQVHLCKNVILPSDIRMQEVLAELQRTDISKAIDMTQKEYKHGGAYLAYLLADSRTRLLRQGADATRPKGKRKDKGRMERERK